MTAWPHQRPWRTRALRHALSGVRSGTDRATWGDEGQSHTLLVLTGAALALALVVARALAITTGHGRLFWYVWSVVVAAVSFFWPIAGVALSLGNVFVSLDDASPFGLSVGQLAGSAASLRMLLQLAIHRLRLRHIWRPSHLALAALAVIMVLGYFGSDDLSGLLVALRKLLLNVLLYVLACAYVTSPKKLLFVQAALAFSAGLGAIWAMLQAPTLVGLAEPRATGLTGNPNYAAIYYAVALPLVIGLALQLEKSWLRAPLIAMGAALAGGIIATASRGGLLSLGIALLITSLLWGKQRRREVRWALIFVLIILVVSLGRADYTRTRYGNMLASLRGGTYQSADRLRLAEASLAVWRRYPLLGAGVGNWYEGVVRVQGSAPADSAHVWPAQILAEMGALGLLAYVTFVLLCLKDYAAVICAEREAPRGRLTPVRAFLASALVLSASWTSGNWHNQLWFTLLVVGPLLLRMHVCPKARRSLLLMANRNLTDSTWGRAEEGGVL